MILKDEEATTRKFKKAGVPWEWKIIKEVKSASLNLLKKYFDCALEEIAKLEGSTSVILHRRQASLLKGEFLPSILTWSDEDERHKKLFGCNQFRLKECTCIVVLTGAALFTFRVHQFAGGLDSPCLSQFEIIRAKYHSRHE